MRFSPPSIHPKRRGLTDRRKYMKSTVFVRIMIIGMRKPKGMTSKTWKRHLEIAEMNRKIIKNKMKSSVYVPNSIDELLMDAGEYKANKKK
jgi:hypothetical protein